MCRIYLLIALFCFSSVKTAELRHNPSTCLYCIEYLAGCTRIDDRQKLYRKLIRTRDDSSCAWLEELDMNRYDEKAGLILMAKPFLKERSKQPTPIQMPTYAEARNKHG